MTYEERDLLLAGELPFFGLNTEEPRQNEIIVSLTSHPGRIKYAHIVLTQMLRQTVKPDRIQLWLSVLQFPDRALPAWADKYKNAGVEFCFTDDDLKPHKKYYYAVKENPHAIVITCDDDYIYEDTFVEKLYLSYLKFPYAISTYAGHKLTFSKQGKLLDLHAWKWMCQEDVLIPSMRLHLSTGPGGLFPPGSLHEEVFNKEAINELCLFDDEFWLKIMSVLKGTPVVLVKPMTQSGLMAIPGSQDDVISRFSVEYIAKVRQNEQAVMSLYNEFLGKDDTVEHRIQTMYQTENDKKTGAPDFYINKGIRKKAVYTAVTGNYDALRKPLFINPDWDYICFYDEPLLNAELISDFWKLIRLEEAGLSPVMLARKVKALPALYLPDYDYSLWMDGNLVIIDDIDSLAPNQQKDAPLMCFNSDFKKCVYNEGMNYVKKGLPDADKIAGRLKAYARQDYPKDIKMADVSVLFRTHNDPELIKVMESWWEDTLSFGSADEFGFNYACWKNNFNYDAYRGFSSNYCKSTFFAGTPHIQGKSEITQALIYTKGTGAEKPKYCAKMTPYNNGRFYASFTSDEIPGIEEANKLFFQPSPRPAVIKLTAARVRYKNAKQTNLTVTGGNFTEPAAGGEMIFNTNDPIIEFAADSLAAGDIAAITFTGTVRFI